MWFSSYKNNALDKRKIMTDDRCCHNMPGNCRKTEDTRLTFLLIK